MARTASATRPAMCCGPGSSVLPGSRWTTPALATKLRMASARRSATRISPGSAPPAPRAASTSSRCCAQATHVIARLIEHPDRCFAGYNAWNAHLEALGVSALKVNPDPVMVATEAALWGSVKAHGFLPDTVIVSDDAGQFNVGQHGLCWVHSERLVHKLDAFTDDNRTAQATVRQLIWNVYRDLITAQGRAAGAVRPPLQAQNRLRHPRPPARAARRQQARVVDGARPTRNPAAHQRIGERHPLPRHPAQGQCRHPQRYRS